jgi:hypothetical protein
MTGFKIQARIQAWLLATTFLLMPLAVQAQAPTKAQQDAIRSNCRSDYMKNCSSVTPGGREALECLMKNKANVSGGCQGALNAIAAPAPAAAKPEPEPKAESARPAPAVAAPGAPEAPKAPPPSAAKPVAPKAAKAPARPAAPPPAEAAAPAPGLAASPPPAAAPDAAPRPMRLGEAIVIRRFCFNDFKVLCKGVQIGQGRAVKCLADNQPALSPGCKQAMAKAGY